MDISQSSSLLLGLFYFSSILFPPYFLTFFFDFFLPDLPFSHVFLCLVPDCLSADSIYPIRLESLPTLVCSLPTDHGLIRRESFKRRR